MQLANWVSTQVSQFPATEFVSIVSIYILSNIVYHTSCINFTEPFQRQEYKNLIKGKTSRLNERRVQLLDSIGFAWELQRGGRRRRLTVSSDAEHGEDEMPVSAAETKSPSEEGGTAPSASETALFPVEDPNSPPPTVGGRRRTTLKKKAIQAEPGASRCILPGVAVLGGGRGAQRPSTSRRRSAGSASSSGGGGSSGAVRADSPISGGDQPLSVNSNEALLRALGNTNHHYSQLSMMQQQGSYQAQQQQQNPLTHHLMLSSQQMMQSGQNPYFTMAGGGGGQYGMPSYGGGGENMASARGMDPPQHPASQGLVHAAAEMYQHPYGYTGGSESKESAGNQYWQAGQQASYWGGPGGPTTAAATAAAQHLQAAAALTAGMDESTLPDHLVPLASIARRMNMQGGGGGGGGGDYNAGVPGGYISANMMQMAAHPNFQQQPSNQFHSQAAVRRGRIGDPPADTPSDEGYGDASPFMINNKRRSEASSMNSPRKKPSTRE